MKKFKLIQETVTKRKGGKKQLERLLKTPATQQQLSQIDDERYLAQMTRCVFNAGFHWRVITAKWDGFEEAFHGFNLGQLLTKSPEEWEALSKILVLFVIGRRYKRFFIMPPCSTTSPPSMAASLPFLPSGLAVTKLG